MYTLSLSPSHTVVLLFLPLSPTETHKISSSFPWTQNKFYFSSFFGAYLHVRWIIWPLRSARKRRHTCSGKVFCHSFCVRWSLRMESVAFSRRLSLSAFPQHYDRGDSFSSFLSILSLPLFLAVFLLAMRHNQIAQEILLIVSQKARTRSVFVFRLYQENLSRENKSELPVRTAWERIAVCDIFGLKPYAEEGHRHSLRRH